MINRNQVVKVTTGAFLLVLGTAEVGQTLITTRDPFNYIVPPGEFSGVGQLVSTRGLCSGSLIESTYFLTAAHCLTTVDGVFKPTEAFVRFPDLVEEDEFVSDVTDYYINPGWTGVFPFGSDIAVLKLAQAAPAEIERYDLYRSMDEAGKNYTLFGYGGTGTGNTGVIDPITSLEQFLNQEKRSGKNRIDLVDTLASVLYSDFDNGDPANDFFGVFADLFESIEELDTVAVLTNTGLGDSEVGIFQGDSGGPGFIDNQIAGVASFFSGCIEPDLQPVCETDIDQAVNGSFGEFFGYTRVSDYTEFVDDAVSGRISPTTPVPEPISGLLTLSTLGVGFFLSRQQK